jgi:hypothetical protein
LGVGEPQLASSNAAAPIPITRIKDVLIITPPATWSNLVERLEQQGLNPARVSRGPGYEKQGRPAESMRAGKRYSASARNAHRYVHRRMATE